MIRESRFGNTRETGLPGKARSIHRGLDKLKKISARKRIYKKWREQQKKRKP